MKSTRTATPAISSQEDQTPARASGAEQGHLSREVRRIKWVPLDNSMIGQPLRLCVAVRLPIAGHPDGGLILLRTTADARVYLGAEIDAGDAVRAWLEIWIQTVAGLEQSAEHAREQLCNHRLDDRWKTMVAACRASDSAGFITTGWETTRPRPSFLNQTTVEVEHPQSEAGDPLVLCVDDVVLRQAGLPGYAGTLQRYWSTLEAGGGRVVVGPIDGSPPNGASVQARHTIAATAGQPLNPEGGWLMIRERAPYSLDDYFDLLNGKASSGRMSKGQDDLQLAAPLGDWDAVLPASGRLFLEGRGRVGRFIEGFHLRLRLWCDLVKLVRDATSRQRLPLLNLTTESFRIHLDARESSLPRLWNARPVLSVPGHAMAVSIPGSDVRHFIPLAQIGTSIFHPDRPGARVRGGAEVRVRKVTRATDGRATVEMTLLPTEPLRCSSRDLLWLRMPLSPRSVELHGHVDAAEGLADGEVRFRSLAQTLEAADLDALGQAEGAVFNAVRFETLPTLSTPCDLYALGVIGVRALLVDSGTTLSVALDEVKSFALEMGQRDPGNRDVAHRALSLARSDPRWAVSLGPQRSSRESASPQEASAWLPESLWWDAVATLARFFPGQGGDSFCRDFGDVSNFAVEQAFDRPLVELDRLVIASRGLLFSDWAANREVAAVINRLRQSMFRK